MTATRLPQKLSRARRVQNNAAVGLVVLGTVIVLLPLVLISGYLLLQGVSSLNLNFFIQTPKPIGESGGGMGQAIVGSLIMIGLALVIGSLVGIASGIFLSEYSTHWLTRPIRLLSDVLTGVPAIVVGLVIYALLVRPLHSYSGLAGGVALGLIMIPIVVRSSEEVLKLVPTNLREAGLALGLPRWKVITAIVLPAARGGIVTGVMLAVARVSGEAAPLLFTALGTSFWKNGASCLRLGILSL